MKNQPIDLWKINILIYTTYHLIPVEWSMDEDFSSLTGEQIIEDPRYLHYEIPNLTQGNAYYVRVRAWNIKGFGNPAASNPPSAVPSCE